MPRTPSQKSIEVCRSAPTSVMWWTPWAWSLRMSARILDPLELPAVRVRGLLDRAQVEAAHRNRVVRALDLEERDRMLAADERPLDVERARARERRELALALVLEADLLGRDLEVGRMAHEPHPGPGEDEEE